MLMLSCPGITRRSRPRTTMPPFLVRGFSLLHLLRLWSAIFSWLFVRLFNITSVGRHRWVEYPTLNRYKVSGSQIPPEWFKPFSHSDLFLSCEVFRIIDVGI